MKTTIEDLITRRSIRKYKPTQITQEELDTVLLAGTYAPTALNRQSPLTRSPGSTARYFHWSAPATHFTARLR